MTKFNNFHTFLINLERKVYRDYLISIREIEKNYFDCKKYFVIKVG